MMILALMTAVEILTLVLRLVGKKRFAAWALALSTLPILVSLGLELTQPARVGAAAVQTDLKTLAIELPVPALALLSLWRPAQLCFWLAWAVNLVFIAMFLYLALAWHPFA